MVNHGDRIASNSQAELGAILETLHRNTINDIEVESDSLSSLWAICMDSNKYEGINWIGVQNADLLKSILIRLRSS